MAKKYRFLVAVGLFITAVLAACQTAEPEVIEVTRVVTKVETVEVQVEGETVEVTRVVERTVVETVLVEVETDEAEETNSEPPFSRGSEGDAVPLPTPVSGPKVGSDTTQVGFNNTGDGGRAGIAMDTAVDITLAQTSQLTAGEVDDNQNLGAYLAYLQTYTRTNVLPIDVSQQILFRVLDEQERPIRGAQVSISADDSFVTTLRTQPDGTATFFPRLYAAADPTSAYTIDVQIGVAAQTITVPANSPQREWIVSFSNIPKPAPQPQVDVLFLIDSTGSMADEINQLKDNIISIGLQVRALPAQPDIRFSWAAYKDAADDFRLFPFTASIEGFANTLGTIEALGGGDYPEALSPALVQAIEENEWRGQETIQLIFLIADAPPHLEGPVTYLDGIRAANERGIKIYPIASSGLDRQGEYIFRQLAQMTHGRFIFLTETNPVQTEPAPETSLAAAELEYTVSALDALIVQIIAGELSAFSPSPP